MISNISNPCIYIILGFEQVGAACRSETVSHIRCTKDDNKAVAISEELKKNEDIYRVETFMIMLE